MIVQNVILYFINRISYYLDRHSRRRYGQISRDFINIHAYFTWCKQDMNHWRVIFDL